MSTADLNRDAYRHSLAIFQQDDVGRGGVPSRDRKFEEEATFLDEAAMADAAEAVREVEINATEPDVSKLNKGQLQHMNIDELRSIAKTLDVPNREQLTEQSELMEAIASRL